jgi:formylmethanofuran dehydrogenase subunit C
MCSGNGGSETFAATNGGKIYIDAHVGSWTGRVAGGGQILDFDGTVLLS